MHRNNKKRKEEDTLVKNFLVPRVRRTYALKRFCVSRTYQVRYKCERYNIQVIPSWLFSPPLFSLWIHYYTGPCIVIDFKYILKYVFHLFFRNVCVRRLFIIALLYKLYIFSYKRIVNVSNDISRFISHFDIDIYFFPIKKNSFYRNYWELLSSKFWIKYIIICNTN